MASDLPRFANYMGLSLRMQYQFDNPTCGTYSVFIHIPGMLQGIQHQKEQLRCLPLIGLKT